MVTINGQYPIAGSGGRVSGPNQQPKNPKEIVIFNNGIPVQQSQQTAQVGNTENVNTKVIETGKKACQSDLDAFKKIGVKVSEWDKNNTCKLSHQGHTATVTIDNTGKAQFGGDFAYMSQLLQASDPQQQQAIQNMNNFLTNLKSPIVGEPKPLEIKVNGQNVSVLEIKTQNGEIHYLDENGIEVKPDAS